MEQQDKNIGTLLGDIGCEFRRITIPLCHQI